MRKSEVRNRRSDVRGIIFFLIAVLCPLTSLFAQATYVPRAIKELEDARGVSLSLKFAPMWDGTKFTPRFISQSDVTDLVSDLSGKVPVSRTVNGHPLSSDVTIAYGDLDGPFPTFPASMGATASNFFTSYNSASGLFTKAQPVFSDLSGTPTTLTGYGITDGVANSRTVNGHPLSANVTVAYSELGGPFPTFPANTGATTNQFFTAYADTTGLFTKAQPSIANLSDAGTLATWAGITPGTGVGTFLATPTLANLNTAITGTDTAAAGANADITSLALTGHVTNSFTSLASDPALYFTGSWLTGGTGTTNFPHLLLQATGTTASTTWSTAGTGLGANAVTGFTGNYLDFKLAGTSKFNITSTGALVSSGTSWSLGSLYTATLTATGTNDLYLDSTSASRAVYLTNQGTNNINLAVVTAGAFTGSGKLIGWSSTANAATTADTSLARNAAGVVEVNNGTAGTLRDITLRNATASGTLAVTGASTLTGKLGLGAAVTLKGYTVATLPASPAQGDTAFVTDGLAPTYNAAAVGGGSVVAPVFYNGTIWTFH